MGKALAGFLLSMLLSCSFIFYMASVTHDPGPLNHKPGTEVYHRHGLSIHPGNE
jgi:hypothetical protein